MFEQYRKKPPSLTTILEQTLQNANHNPITVKELYLSLHGKGLPIVLILFSLPMCFPIQIPGFSMPFGIFLMLIGFSIAFGKSIWLPQWIEKKVIPYNNLEKIILQSIKLANWVQKYLHPRLSFLTQAPLFHMIHGFTITLLAFLLALPLPLPLTNVMTAAPMVVIGLGLLEEDGAAIIVGYILALLGVSYYAAFLWVGASGAVKLWTGFAS